MGKSTVLYTSLVLLTICLYLSYLLQPNSTKIQNMLDDCWSLPSTQKVELVVPPKNMDWIQDGAWKPFNPSIRREQGNYAVILRYANNETKDGIYFTYRAHKGFTMNRTVIADFDKNFKIVSDKKEPMEVVIPSHYIQNKKTNIYGIEDCRWLGTNSFLGTAAQFSEGSVNRMVRVDMDPTTRTVSKLQRLYAPILKEDTTIQKNWLPFIRDGQELYVYKISPFIVCNMNNEIVLEWKSRNANMLTTLHGSAAPVPWQSKKFPSEAWLMIVHFYDSDSWDIFGGNRVYYHQFMTLDINLVPSRISHIFTFAKERIQYISGLCESLQDGRYVITAGINDSQAWALEVEAAVIENALIKKL